MTVLFNEINLPDAAAGIIETGKCYKLEVFDVHRLTFFHKKENREIFIVGDEVLPVNGSYLYDWRSIVYLLIGCLALAGMTYLLFTFYNS